MSTGHLHVFFGEMSIKVFCPFFDWIFLLLSCMVCLFEIKPWSIASFANTFSHSLGCLFFFFFMVLFAVQKVVSLIRSPLFICGFISITLGDLPKKTKVQFMSENILPMLSSRSFMASCLIFQSLNHCEIFLCSVRVYSNSTDLHAASNYTSTWLALEESLSLLFLYLILHVSILKFFKTRELGDGCG